MKKLFFFLVIFTLIMSSLNAQKQLKNFDELIQSLKSGKNINKVVFYKKCKLIADNEEKEKVPDAVAGMQQNVFEYFAKDAINNKQAFLVASESKLIQNPKGEGFVYNYVKMKVYEDNKVKITAQYLDAKTFEVKMDENFFCEINNGKNENGIYFLKVIK